MARTARSRSLPGSPTDHGKEYVDEEDRTAARLTATLMLAGGALGLSAGAATAEDFDRDYAFSPPVSEWSVAPQETDWQVAPLEIDWN